MPASATSTEAPIDLPSLRAAVQHNCDLADARHADGKSLCTYLLGLRELFLWESGLPPGTAPDRAALSAWIAERERRWDALAGADEPFASLPLASGLDAFDDEAANVLLAASGLVYGAGIGLFGAPQFFLAESRSLTERDGARLIVAGAELARGMVAPPAVSRGRTIVIRLDALRRWLRTRIEGARRSDSFAAALRCHGDPADPATLERLAEGAAEMLILHELGELQVTRLLGAEWEAMLADIGDRRTELLVRAVRDLLSDCLVTLPALAARRDDGSLHFWRANFDGLQRQLAPQLAAAFGDRPGWVDHAAVDDAALAGQRQWHRVADQLLSAWRSGGQPLLQARVAALAPAG